MSKFLSVKSSPLWAVVVVGFLQLFGAPKGWAAGLPFPERLNLGPTTLSMGGAAAASVTNHEAFLTNPAGLAYFQGQSSIGGHWEGLPNDESSWSISTVDGTHGIIGGFHFGSTDFQQSRRQDYTFAAVYKTTFGALGVTGQALHFSGVAEGRGWHFTGSAGVFVPVVWNVSFAAYSNYFMDLQKKSQFPPSAHLGILYMYPGSIRVTFEADRTWKIAHQDWNYSTGADFLGIKYIAVRGGYHWDESDSYSFWSTGLALVAPRIEVAGSFIRKTKGPSGDGMGFEGHLKF